MALPNVETDGNCDFVKKCGLKEIYFQFTVKNAAEKM